MFNSKLINISKLAQKAGVPYFQIYRRQNGETQKELPPNTRTKLFNALWKEVKDIADDLGFTVTATRKDV
jgi:hypothetical protein